MQTHGIRSRCRAARLAGLLAVALPAAALGSSPGVIPLLGPGGAFLPSDVYGQVSTHLAASAVRTAPESSTASEPGSNPSARSSDRGAPGSPIDRPPAAPSSTEAGEALPAAAPEPPVARTLRRIARYRHARAFPQAFELAEEALLEDGFRADIAQALVDTVLSSGDAERGLALAASLGGLAGRVLEQHLLHATRADVPDRALEAIVSGDPPEAEGHLVEIYTHLLALSRRVLHDGAVGRSLELLALAKIRDGQAAVDELLELAGGPPSWRLRLSTPLAELSPLATAQGDYLHLLDRFLSAAARGDAGEARVRELSARLQERCSRPERHPGCHLAAALLAARRGDAGRALELATLELETGSPALSHRVNGCNVTESLADSRTADGQTCWISLGEAITLADQLRRAGLNGPVERLATALEQAWAGVLERRLTARADAAPRVAPDLDLTAIHGQLGELAAIAGRDGEALDHLARALEWNGDPLPALAVLERLGSLDALRPRVIELLRAAATVPHLARAAAARLLERAGELEEALTEWRVLVEAREVPEAALRAARLEEELGRPDQAVEVLARGLLVHPAAPGLVDELVRISGVVHADAWTVRILTEMHPALPRADAGRRRLLERLDSLATDSSSRSLVASMLAGWAEGAAELPAEVEIARAGLAAREGRMDEARALALEVSNHPPDDPEWGWRLLDVMQESAGPEFPVTAARLVAPRTEAGEAMFLLARSKWLRGRERFLESVHDGLRALDHDPGSERVCRYLAPLVKKYVRNSHLMGAFYLKTWGNPLYAAFQARYRVLIQQHDSAQAYFRAAMQAFPDDLDLKYEYAAYLDGRGETRRAGQCYELAGERLGYVYRPDWAEPLLDVIVRRTDRELLLAHARRWLVQPEAVAGGLHGKLLELADGWNMEAAILSLTEEALEKEPCSVALWEMRAALLSRLDRLEDASRSLEEREALLRSPRARLPMCPVGPAPAGLQEAMGFAESP